MLTKKWFSYRRVTMQYGWLLRGTEESPFLPFQGTCTFLVQPCLAQLPSFPSGITEWKHLGNSQAFSFLQITSIECQNAVSTLDTNITEHAGASPSTFWEGCGPLETQGDGAPWREPADTHESYSWKLLHILLPCCFIGTTFDWVTYLSDLLWNTWTVYHGTLS